jgi:thiamine biosynthesis lipoprotein
MTMRSRSAVNRRRFLRITAASAAFAAAGSGAGATQPGDAVAGLSTWRGIAFGNLASITLRHPDSARTAYALRMIMTEIERLESIMSLYRADSALSQLNLQGHLHAAPSDLVQVLSRARSFGDLSGGSFDVTVQPLWRVYADHFSVRGADPAGPSLDLIRRSAEMVDYRGVEVEPSAIRLARSGMAVTLNGIAQGYITDRIIELLKNEGFEHMLADLGEIRALGRAAPDRPWRAALKNPLDEQTAAAEIDLGSEALATSGSYGFRFDSAGRFHHLFDPQSGACPQRYASVSVLAPDATAADALATACNLLPQEAIAGLLQSAGASRAYLTMLDGSVRLIDA